MPTQYPLGANPLKYWIQNVLPVVYEDDLSYMELVSKLVRYYNSLRDIMEKQGELDAEMQKEIAAIQEWIKQYPASEVETAVLNIMNEWKDDGTLVNLLIEAVGGAVRYDDTCINVCFPPKVTITNPETQETEEVDAFEPLVRNDITNEDANCMDKLNAIIEWVHSVYPYGAKIFFPRGTYYFEQTALNDSIFVNYPFISFEGESFGSVQFLFHPTTYPANLFTLNKAGYTSQTNNYVNMCTFRNFDIEIGEISGNSWSQYTNTRSVKVFMCYGIDYCFFNWVRAEGCMFARIEEYNVNAERPRGGAGNKFIDCTCNVKGDLSLADNDQYIGIYLDPWIVSTWLERVILNGTSLIRKQNTAIGLVKAGGSDLYIANSAFSGYHTCIKILLSASDNLNGDTIITGCNFDKTQLYAINIDGANKNTDAQNSGIIISNNYIRAETVLAGSSSTSIRIADTNKVTVSNNLIGCTNRNMSHTGIAMARCNSCIISGNVFDMFNLELDDNNRPTGHAIIASGAKNIKCEYVIANNQFNSNNGYEPIFISNAGVTWSSDIIATGISITGNTFLNTNNSSKAIYIAGGTNTVIATNVFDRVLGKVMEINAAGSPRQEIGYNVFMNVEDNPSPDPEPEPEPEE